MKKFKFFKSLPKLPDVPKVSLPSSDTLLKDIKPKSKRRFVAQIILSVLAVYVAVGIIDGVLVYAKKSTAPTIQSISSIYPFPAVYVNGYLIKVNTIFKRINYATKFSEQSGQKIESVDTLRAKAIDQEVESVLVLQEMKKLNLRIDPKAVESAYNDVVSKNGGEAEVKKVLKALYGMNTQDFKELIAIQLRKDKFREQGLQRVKVRHILVANEDEAKKLIEQINKGEKKFEDAAKDSSKDSNSKDNGGLISGDDGKGGKIDSIAPGTMPQAFDEVVFVKAEPGKVYPDPVKTDFGFHIIKLEERTGKVKQSYQAWLDEARKKARIIRFLK